MQRNNMMSEPRNVSASFLMVVETYTHTHTRLIAKSMSCIRSVLL